METPVINENSNPGGDTMSVITSDQICNMVREVALTCTFFDPNDFVASKAIEEDDKDQEILDFEDEVLDCFGDSEIITVNKREINESHLIIHFSYEEDFEISDPYSDLKKAAERNKQAEDSKAKKASEDYKPVPKKTTPPEKPKAEPKAKPKASPKKKSEDKAKPLSAEETVSTKDNPVPDGEPKRFQEMLQRFDADIGTANGRAKYSVKHKVFKAQLRYQRRENVWRLGLLGADPKNFPELPTTKLSNKETPYIDFSDPKAEEILEQHFDSLKA